MSPRTRSFSARRRAVVRISSTSAGDSENGGTMQVESPEWMPASSMCSITPHTIARGASASCEIMRARVPSLGSKSATTSTSTSIASLRNRSMRTGAFARSLTLTAVVM